MRVDRTRTSGFPGAALHGPDAVIRRGDVAAAAMGARAGSAPRSVLFLQGPPSGFARALGAELRRHGARVHRVNFCLGDWIYWHGAGTGSYRGTLAEWPARLDQLIDAKGVTDLLYFGDRTPYHKAARAVAERRGVRVLAYEYGYLRPDWILAEPGGQSAYSQLTTDPARLRRAARDVPPVDLARRHAPHALAEDAGDVIYHLSNYLVAVLWPHYRRDRVFNPVLEYLSYLPRFVRAARGAGAAHALADRFRRDGTPFFLATLQMQNDYQVRANSPYRDQRVFLDEVVRSFAADAPAAAHLVVKLHPHDNGLTPWRRSLARVARRAGVTDRVHLLDGGRIEEWAAAARGLVTINSTAGMMALTRHCPVHVAGIAIYDMPGLTHQGGLGRFWTAPRPPDPALLDDVLRVLAAHLHVRGDFYGAGGQRAAVEALARRILCPGPPPDIFDAEPPRLDRARRIGVPVDE